MNYLNHEVRNLSRMKTILYPDVLKIIDKFVTELIKYDEQGLKYDSYKLFELIFSNVRNQFRDHLYYEAYHKKYSLLCYEQETYMSANDKIMLWEEYLECINKYIKEFHEKKKRKGKYVFDLHRFKRNMLGIKNIHNLGLRFQLLRFEYIISKNKEYELPDGSYQQIYKLKMKMDDGNRLKKLAEDTMDEWDLEMYLDDTKYGYIHGNMHENI